MSDQNLILALAKVLVAAAWADGQIATEELNSLKDLLFQLPGLTASDWVQIEIYLDSPVDAAERQRLVSDLENRLSSEADKQQVMAALDQLSLIFAVWRRCVDVMPIGRNRPYVKRPP